MGREKTPLKRESKGNVTINIRDIFRNPDVQDEVIKEINSLKDTVKKLSFKFENEDGTLKNSAIFLNDLFEIPEIKHLIAADGMQWVACKEALPKHETDVICYCLDFEVRVGRKTGDSWFIDGYSLPQDITHWQELPKSPCL